METLTQKEVTSIPSITKDTIEDLALEEVTTTLNICKDIIGTHHLMIDPVILDNLEVLMITRTLEDRVM